MKVTKVPIYILAVHEKGGKFMREQEKQKIRDMIVTLGKAEAILDSRTKKKDEDAVHQLLSDMQSSAIAIGTAIEEAEGDGTEVVRHLEDYCEYLYQYMIAETLQERFQMGRVLAGKRAEVSAALEREVEGRLSVVFLLCKAERWKQMEELWRVARATPEYDCQVVVAPYIKNQSNGLAGLVCDETGELPAEVGAIDYDSFDIRYCDPDLVFVDGPYAGQDGAGAVFGYDLLEVKENCGALIYMPVYGDDETVNEGDCLLPQVELADMIIVPSERIRREYINLYNLIRPEEDIACKLQVLDPVSPGRMFNKYKAH